MPGPSANWTKDEDFAKDFKIELWDVVEARALTDDGRPQCNILLRRAGPPESPSVQSLGFGGIGVFEFLAASDDYHAWWMLQGEGHPMVGKCQHARLRRPRCPLFGCRLFLPRRFAVVCKLVAGC